MPLFDDDNLFDGSDPLAPLPVPPTPPPGYLGRFQVGQSVPLSVIPLDGQGFPATPAAAPIATVLDPDQDEFPGCRVAMAMAGDSMHFALPFFLGTDLSLGTYSVTYTYGVGNGQFSIDGSFDLIPGGDPGGSVISMFSYDRPEARYVVAQLSSGRLVQGRNPR